MKGTKRNTGRKYLIRASVLASAGVMSTVTGIAASSATASASSTVTLQFWNTYNAAGTPSEFSTMQGILNKFEKENPGIKVTSVKIPYGDLLAKFIAAAAAGDPPAVLRSDIAWVPSLAADGVLVNMSRQKWAQPILKGALPGPLSTNYYEGSYYGIPDDTNTQALFWNKTLFAAAGLSGPPTTLAQMWTDAATLTNSAKGIFGLSVGGTDLWNVAPFIWSNGGALTNSGLTSATGYMNGTATEATITELLSLQKAGDIGSDFVGGSGAISDETGFSKGEYAMEVDGPWAVPTFAGTSGLNYGVTTFPAGAGGSISTVGGEDLVIARDAPNIADAKLLAAFLASPYAQTRMAARGDMSGYSADAAVEVKQNPYLGVFAQQLLTARARPVAPGYPELDADFTAELQEVLAGNLSVSDAMNVAAQEANAALSNP
jgi:multiple sugar transport system substrate-binding protein